MLSITKCYYNKNYFVIKYKDKSRIVCYINTMSNYHFNVSKTIFKNTLKRDYNAILSDYETLLFKNFEDAKRAVDWLESLLMIQKIVEN